jgi:hypothetical protein
VSADDDCGVGVRKQLLASQRHAVFVGSGYRAGAFEVEAAYPPRSPRTVNGTTRCYPGELQRADIRVPEVLRAD